MMPDVMSTVWFLATAAALGLLLWLGHMVLIARRADLDKERLLVRQVIMLVLSLIAVVVFLLAMPVSGDVRTHLMALFGLLLSAIIAFSSSTIFANMMAGIMLRITRPFRTGDFVTVGEFAGRVTQQGLFDTEIQSVDRELVAIPHVYMIGRPVAVQPRAESMVSAELSLGYDQHHVRVEQLLVEAARGCGLESPFVQILALGDHSVVYKISGRLVADDALITARSDLHRQVLDVLHGAHVEIMSPTFVGQRRLSEGHTTVPQPPRTAEPADQTAAEAVVFDKAEAAVAREEHMRELQQRMGSLQVELTSADGSRREELQARLRAVEEELKGLEVPPGE